MPKPNELRSTPIHREKIVSRTGEATSERVVFNGDNEGRRSDACESWRACSRGTPSNDSGLTSVCEMTGKARPLMSVVPLGDGPFSDA